MQHNAKVSIQVSKKIPVPLKFKALNRYPKIELKSSSAVNKKISVPLKFKALNRYPSIEPKSSSAVK